VPRFLSIQIKKGPVYGGAFLVKKQLASVPVIVIQLFSGPYSKVADSAFFGPGALRIFQVSSPSGAVGVLMGAGLSLVV
jgi:hypothetical protein